MAPDLNTMPVSPRPNQASQPSPQPTSLSTSRRTSQVMGPPPALQLANNPISASHRSPTVSSSEQAGLPLRHPRPLTAAELYLECEKEQEAVVNRLTRELTALRAQSASVASNASHSSTSTSASLLPIDISDPNPTHQLTGSTHPIPSRRHRSSSSVSNRSFQHPPSHAQPSSSASTSIPINNAAGSVITSPPIGIVSQASADRAAAAGGTPLSRQPSASALNTSNSARQSLDLARHPHRPSISREHSLASQQTTLSTSAQAGSHQLPSPGLAPSSGLVTAMQHVADATAYRTEMEIVRAENEALRQRVRALERALRAANLSSSTPTQQSSRRRRDSSQSDASALATRPSRENLETSSARASMLSLPPSATGSASGVAIWAANDGGIGGVAGPRERSESQSTTASSRRGTAFGGDDDVRVGESASSLGVGRGV